MAATLLAGYDCAMRVSVAARLDWR